MTAGTASGRVARGADGGSPLRQLYRHSWLRHLKHDVWDHRGLRPNDVLLASYPRSGNAWLRFLVQELAGRAASFDTVRFDIPYVGRQRRAPSLVPGGGRFIKTHAPYRPQDLRAIHLVRDPRDIVLSYFRYMQRLGRIVFRPDDDPVASFDIFVGAFLAGRVDAHGTWQAHLRSWLDAAQRGDARILRLRYEDMRADPALQVGTIASFLGFDISAAQAMQVAERCSLDRMREAERESDLRVFGRVRPDVPYVGPASVGGWHSALTTAQQHRFTAFADGLAAMGYEAPL